MATIASLALAIRARTEKLKQDLAPALEEIKNWGKAAEASGADAKEVGREMARMRAEALKGMQDNATSTGAFRDKLQAAKTGAAALAGAIGAVASEVKGSVGPSIQLGTSLASAFLAGGPIALGVTAVTAAIASIAGSAAEARKELERTRKEMEDFVRAGRESVESDLDAAQGLRDRMREKRGEVAEGFAEEQALRRRFGRRQRVLDEGLKEERRKIEEWTRERAELSVDMLVRTGGKRDQNEETAKRDAWIEAARARIAVMEEQKAAARELEQVEAESNAFSLQQSIELKQEAQRRAEATALVAVRERQVGEQLRASGQAARDLATADEKRAEQSEKGLRLARERVAELRKAEAQRAKEETASNLAMGGDMAVRLGQRLNALAEERRGASARAEALRRELDLLTAATEADRKRLRIKEDLRKSIEAAKGDQAQIALAEKIAAVEGAKVAQEEAKEATKKAEAQKRATEELQKQKQLMKEQLDITKRFADFGGAAGGVFGFGAGVVGYGWSAGRGDMARRSNKPAAAAAKAPAAAAAGADLSPKLKSIEEALGKLPGAFEREAAAVASLERAVLSGTDRIVRAAEKSITSVKLTVRDHERRLDDAERRLAQAGDVGID